MRRIVVFAIVLLGVVGGLGWGATTRPAAAGSNLLRNPGFEGPYNAWQVQYGTAQVAAEWTPWWVEDANRDPVWAQPEWKPAERQFYPNRVFEGERAQQWFTFHKSHYAGMYQQVFGVTPGQRYRFTILVQVWSSTEDNPNRSVTTGDPRVAIGIDPTGAAQPGWVTGPPGTVVWSADAPMDGVLDQWYTMAVEAVARNSTITVYLRSNPQYAVKHNNYYIDAAQLTAIGSPPPAATATPAPPRPSATPAPGGDPCTPPTSGPWPCADPRGPWGSNPPAATPRPSATPAPGSDPCAPPPSGPWPCADPRGPWGSNPPAATPPTAAPPTAAPPSAPPPTGGNFGPFALGGQTHSFANPGLMTDVGMTWVKFQHKWAANHTPDMLAGRIQDAKARGFKVLMSIPGADHSAIDFGAYVNFLRGVAALPTPPDAIEIWNEQNIDREWPAGQINAAQYVNAMLKPAYQAIKATNANIMVISGAPAPTGFFGGCGPAGCDDKPYMEAMFAAGAAAYTDCVGIHYNEGILPPSQRSGDPRGNGEHYTRYFWGMVDTYFNAFRGSRPLCFTELGYLTGDGFGQLPGGFAWAQNTTIEQHANWLGEAITLSRNSGKVRLFIIFNIDFTHYDPNGDPQAGYAMVRPNGSCPACGPVRAAMGR